MKGLFKSYTDTPVGLDIKYQCLLADLGKMIINYKHRTSAITPLEMTYNPCCVNARDSDCYNVPTKDNKGDNWRLQICGILYCCVLGLGAGSIPLVCFAAKDCFTKNHMLYTYQYLDETYTALGKIEASINGYSKELKLETKGKAITDINDKTISEIDGLIEKLQRIKGAYYQDVSKDETNYSEECCPTDHHIKDLNSVIDQIIAKLEKFKKVECNASNAVILAQPFAAKSSAPHKVSAVESGRVSDQSYQQLGEQEGQSAGLDHKTKCCCF